MRDVYVIKITWENDLGPLIGPVVGLTRSRKLCTIIRKRLRANNQPFKSVSMKMLSSVNWFFGLECMLDPVDRLLASVDWESFHVLAGNTPIPEKGEDPPPLPSGKAQPTD